MRPHFANKSHTSNKMNACMKRGAAAALELTMRHAMMALVPGLGTGIHDSLSHAAHQPRPPSPTRAAAAAGASCRHRGRVMQGIPFHPTHNTCIHCPMNRRAAPPWMMGGRAKKQKDWQCSTEASHVIPQRTTSSAQASLASEIGREPAYSHWFDRTTHKSYFLWYIKSKIKLGRLQIIGLKWQSIIIPASHPKAKQPCA